MSLSGSKEEIFRFGRHPVSPQIFDLHACQENHVRPTDNFEDKFRPEL